MKILLFLVTLAFAAAAFAETPPTRFVTQQLSPADGQVKRPESWFYSESYQPWTHWGNDGLDVTIFSTALTSKELWPAYASTFEKMSEFEIRYPTSSR